MAHEAPDLDTGVLFLNAFAGEGMGGGEVQTVHLVRGLVERGVKVHLMCPPGALAEQAACVGASVHPHAFSARSVFADARPVRERADAAGCSIVHGTGYVTNMVARLARRRDRLAVVNTVHVVPGASVHQSGSRVEAAVRNAIDRLTLQRVDALVAVSQAVAAALEEARLVPPSGVRIIEGGIDIATVRSGGSDSVDGLPRGDGPLVGFLGRMERVKGPDVFADACVLLARRRSDVRFAIAGAGSLAEPTARVLAAGCGARASALGYVGDAPAFLRNLDVLVVPSRSEAVSLVALEAMALGVPVAASAVGGLVELLERSGAGVLVPPEDASALAEAIERVLDDASARERMSEAGRAYVERFSVDRMVDEYVALYRDMLERMRR